MPSESTQQLLTADLRELISALDRRVPHLEREGEAAIASAAADLRERALAMIAALTAKPT